MAGTVTASVIKNDTTTPPQFQNSAGTEIGTLCRAWVKFVGSTGSISASFNVSSVTRNGTGDYTANFTTSMPDANYSVAGTSFQSGNSGIQGVTGGTSYSFAVGSLRFFTRTTANAYDPDVVCLSIFR